MGIWNVIIAGLAAWAAGLVWYARFGAARQAAGGEPLSGRRRVSVALAAAIVMILVAGFLRHIFFVSQLTSNIPLGFVAGLGVGLFFVGPWLWLVNLADARPVRLALIDGGYATIATGIMGALLVAF